MTSLKCLHYQFQFLRLIVHFRILAGMGRHFRQCFPLFRFYQPPLDVESEVDIALDTKKSCRFLMLLFAIAGHQLSRLDDDVGDNKSFNESTSRETNCGSLPASNADNAGYVLIRENQAHFLTKLCYRIVASHPCFDVTRSATITRPN